MEKHWEIMLIAKPEKDTATAVMDKVSKVLAEAKILKTQEWGKKPLAYEIQNLKTGYYYLVDFLAEPALVKELDRVLRITDDCLRHMIVRKGE